TEVADAPDDARNVDHAAPAAGRHGVDEAPGDLEDGAEVGVEHLVPGRPIHLAEHAVARDARVVDQDIDALELVADARAHGGDVYRKAHVAAVGTSASAQCVDLVANALGVRPTGRARADRHFGTGGRERQRASAPYAARATGDEHLLTGQAEA